MIKTISKHVKWRKDNGVIFICDCKRLIDLKIEFKHESFMEKLDKGIEKEKLSEEEKEVFSDFEKMNLISKLKIKRLTEKDFPKAMKILDNELGKDRTRDDSFLHEKFKQFPQFFLGLFLEDEIIGIICGFPREDYLLMSEIAIDSRFQRRGFGKRLVKAFETIAKKDYKQINVGTLDESIPFYESLNYKPFLLVQFKKGEYSKEDFKDFKIIKSCPGIIEIKIKKPDVTFLNNLRKKYPKANFQYIFYKRL